MSETQILIHGVVQGVGFRPTVYRVAMALGLRGFVRNNGSNVEVVIDGDADRFMAELKKALPPLARLDRVEVRPYGRKRSGLKDFVILDSKEGSRDAPVPPDTAICPECLKEMLSPKDRRHMYPFTNCTNCGARFSVIVDMPYDRPNTSMDEFRLCNECKKEYRDPMNRRFHAQTISCWKEGLTFKLYDKDGRVVRCDDPIKEFAKRTDNGAIGVVKGWGGMHITCILDKVPAMREWYKRPSKPFAVMVRDIKVARRLAVIDDFAEGVMTGPERPITIVPKKDPRALEGVSPGLCNVGLYLPYGGMHHLLFKHLEADALVMTSANPAGEPMIIDNEEAFSLDLDAYLLHNRRIVNRVDDSVLIPFDGRRFFIRKSRGFTPLFLPVRYKGTVLSVGPERNVNASISKDGRLYTSQYIGHAYKYNVMGFLEHGTRYLMRLLGIKALDAVAMDLHPQYPTRAFAKRMSEEFKAPLFEVQHHFAHSTSLMLDNGVTDTIACISVDGTGYGTDGTVWGGEVLVNDLSRVERVGCLQPIQMLGGDAAVHDPKRMVFAIREALDLGNDLVPDREAEVYRKLMKSSVVTSSLGRVLDALSCWLGVCCTRTYDGEPAMRLETLLDKGSAKHLKAFEEVATIEGSKPVIIKTIPMFGRLDELLCTCGKDDGSKADLATSFITALMKKMVEVAADAAERAGSRFVGLTGGVSYNLPIVRVVDQEVDRRGMSVLLHDTVPNGDGGISIGQNVYVGERLKR